MASAGHGPPIDFLEHLWQRSQDRDPVSRASIGDLLGWLPNDLNHKADIASMAHALEVRQPFLDVRLVEWAATLPIGLKYRPGRGKLLLRHAFGADLPSHVFNRKKMGFSIPLADWFRDELGAFARDQLLSPGARSAEWFAPLEVERLFKAHESATEDHGDRLWALLVFELWLRRWF